MIDAVSNAARPVIRNPFVIVILLFPTRNDRPAAHAALALLMLPGKSGIATELSGQIFDLAYVARNSRLSATLGKRSA
ncbi:MAG: hypothetical protein ACOYLS_04805 [Polymorphobacter sp.]